MSRKIGILLTITVTIVLTVLCSGSSNAEWKISALPPSVRIDPVEGRIIEDRPDIYNMDSLGALLDSNWVFDGSAVNIFAARGEYVSFQIVLEAPPGDTLHDIEIELPALEMGGKKLAAQPELFLEWAVRVDEKSYGYDKASYGPGWYPDALIPLDIIAGGSMRGRRIMYPLRVPDFVNRVPGQRFLVFWVDQFVPFEREDALPGEYNSEVRVRVGEVTRTIPVNLTVWDFELPNENNLRGNLQQGGFMRGLDDDLRLEVYQLMKRHRIVPVDQTYRPELDISASGEVTIDWSEYDRQIGPILTGEAFTEKYGYSGPGYGEPVEMYLLPFNCWSDHRGTPRRGWPDVGSADQERKPENRAIYIETIRQVREHVLKMVDPDKTDLVVFLNGLDESYFPEAWDRMVYYGDMFHEHFPEAKHRVDGGYSEEAMEAIHDAIDYWCCHTVGYDMETVETYRKLGIKDWVYGPVLYERRGNSGVGSSTFIDLELANERAISWACWKYRTLTWCSWGIGSNWKSAWYAPETWKFAVRRDDGSTQYRAYNGNALEVYAPGIVPGIDLPCPTLRLKNMRDGVEEYEMLRLLAQLDGNTARADSVADILINRPFGAQSVGNLDVWNHNPGQWDTERVRLGAMIEQAAKK